MLAALLNVPKTEAQWRQFSYDHRDSHDRIRAAIRKKYGVNLTDYVIDPINQDSLQQFLQNNASLHTDMNNVLQSQASDLLDVDITNPQQLDAWISLNYQEHQNAEQLLGIGG
jgi:hypothetical protein